MTERLCLTTLLLLLAANSANALDAVHFLVPGGAGGGWDITARAVGATLADSGIVRQVSYENRSGAGGGKGVAYLQESAARASNMLMVSSTPIVVRSLKPGFQQNWRHLTPVASLIGDFGAIVVRADSPYTDFQALAAALQGAPRGVKFAGGSNRGDLDHLILARVFEALSLEPGDARYVPYGAGGQATLALLGGEVDAMSATGGDAIAHVEAGRLRVLAVAAEARLPVLPDVPTFGELGWPVVFINWRGFFAAPGLAEADRFAFVQMLEALRRTEAWQEVRARYGWAEVYHVGEAFEAYLAEQEALMQRLLSRLGFLP